MLDTNAISKVSSVDLRPFMGCKAFAGSGVTVFAGASGSGKSVFLEEFIKKHFTDGRNKLYYFNYDESPMDIDTYEGVTLEFLKRISAEADLWDTVVIDTFKAFASMNGSDVSSEVEMYKVMEDLTKLSRDTGMTIILVHHTDNDGNLEGAKAIFEGADHVSVFNRDKETGQMTATVCKQRFSFENVGTVCLNDYVEE